MGNDDRGLELIIDTLSEIQNENDYDEIKFYFLKDVDYCFKFIKRGKIVKCVRRGIKRK